MGKGYAVVTYRKINDQEKWAAYAKLALPAIQKAGGRFIVRARKGVRATFRLAAVTGGKVALTPFLQLPSARPAARPKRTPARARRGTARRA